MENYDLCNLALTVFSIDLGLTLSSCNVMTSLVPLLPIVSGAANTWGDTVGLESHIRFQSHWLGNPTIESRNLRNPNHTMHQIQALLGQFIFV